MYNTCFSLTTYFSPPRRYILDQSNAPFLNKVARTSSIKASRNCILPIRCYRNNHNIISICMYNKSSFMFNINKTSKYKYSNINKAIERVNQIDEFDKLPFWERPGANNWILWYMQSFQAIKLYSSLQSTVYSVRAKWPVLLGGFAKKLKKNLKNAKPIKYKQNPHNYNCYDASFTSIAHLHGGKDASPSSSCVYISTC